MHILLDMKTTPELATRYLGNCQLCEGDFKVHDGQMVHHGYKRPGVGYIFGDCPGVSAVPYETSCDLIKANLLGIKNHLSAMRAHLEKLESNQITCVTCNERDYSVVRTRLDDGYRTVYYVAGITPYYTWLDKLGGAVREVQASIRELESIERRYEARIAAWKPLPLRTWEEELAKVKATKDAAKAALEAKRAERRAVLEAKKAKKAQLEARRFAEVDKLAADINAATDDVAREIGYKIRYQTKYQWLRHSYDACLPRLFSLCGERLLKLGLAQRNEHNNYMSLR